MFLEEGPIRNDATAALEDKNNNAMHERRSSLRPEASRFEI
jgi:hypothetical protein